MQGKISNLALATILLNFGTFRFGKTVVYHLVLKEEELLEISMCIIAMVCAIEVPLN